MRSALFLRMTNCNAFAGRFPCPIPWAWKMGSIFDSHAARLSNLGDKIWSLDAVEWKMTPVFDSWPGRGYDLGGQIRVSIWSRIWFGGSDWGIDLPGRLIWGVRLDHRPPGRLIWGVKLDQRPPGRVIWGSFLHHRPVRHPNLGIILVSSTSRKANLGGQIGSPTSRKANLGGRIRSATSRKANLGGRIRLFTCFTPKIFTRYLIVEGIGIPIFFENKVIDLLDSLSKGAGFGTRAGREWEQE